MIWAVEDDGIDMNRNYQKELDNLLGAEGKKGKRLLLHSCCAPCSSYVLIYLRQYFRITVFYYNSNITEQTEYEKRREEQKRLIAVLNTEAAQQGILEEDGTSLSAWREESVFPIEIQEAPYEPEVFLNLAAGLETCPEGGLRCERCFQLRLEETAKLAKELSYDYFTTTLTISPLKNARLLNEIGQQLAEQYEVPFLPSDFKKKEGYKQSVELSRKYDLYRQNYCGCVFSKAEKDSGKKPI